MDITTTNSKIYATTTTTTMATQALPATTNHYLNRSGDQLQCQQQRQQRRHCQPAKQQLQVNCNYARSHSSSSNEDNLHKLRTRRKRERRKVEQNCYDDHKNDDDFRTSGGTAQARPDCAATGPVRVPHNNCDLSPAGRLASAATTTTPITHTTHTTVDVIAATSVRQQPQDKHSEHTQNYNCHLFSKTPLLLTVICQCLLLFVGATTTTTHSQQHAPSLKQVASQLRHLSHSPTQTFVSTGNSRQLLPVVSGTVVSSWSANKRQPMAIGANNKGASVNITHVTVDELNSVVYVGAINWIMQFNLDNLQLERVLKTGPVMDNARDCSPTDCAATIQLVDSSLLTSGAGADLSPQNNNNNNNNNNVINQTRSAINVTIDANKQATQTRQMMSNNYNKILVIDYEQQKLIVCGSVNQGACRRHQLGDIGNFSELIPLPVAANDEHSSTVALVTSSQSRVAPPAAGLFVQPTSGQQAKLSHHLQQQQQQQLPQQPQQPPVMYVAATNTRLGPYRDLVPAISSRYLDSQRAMQIVDKSFTDTARVDISRHLRDYFLVNYIYSFQTQDYVYFATVQRKSHLRSLEEWGYITRLVRICLNDPNLQTYTEMSLQCVATNSNQPQQQQQQPQQQQQQARFSSSLKQQQQATSETNYNLLQDAHLVNASSHLAHQLGIRPQSAVLVGAFSQSKDHTTKSQHKSAICLFPLDKIEQKFNENIHLCYNGSVLSRNIDYIAGSVDECPKPGKAGNIANFCNEPIKLNGSVPLITSPVIVYDNDLITAITSTTATTAPVAAPTSNPAHQQQQHAGGPARAAQPDRTHQILVAGTHDGHIRKIVLTSGEHKMRLRGHEFDSVQLDQEPILADLVVVASGGGGAAAKQQAAPSGAGGEQYIIAASVNKLAKVRLNSCKHSPLQQQPANAANLTAAAGSSPPLTCDQCAQLQDPYCGWCSQLAACTGRQECAQHQEHQQQQPHQPHQQQRTAWLPFDQIRCADYRLVSQNYVALQQDQQLTLDVNINNQTGDAQHFPLPPLSLLTATQFTCHYDYPQQFPQPPQHPQHPQQQQHQHQQQQQASYTVRAHAARLNALTSTVTIGCPLPPVSHRPVGRPPSGAAHNYDSADSAVADSVKVKLTLRHVAPYNGSLVREFRFYDCSQHSTCRSCLQSGAQVSGSGGGGGGGGWTCWWCPTTGRCTHNVTSAQYGCPAALPAAQQWPLNRAQSLSQCPAGQLDGPADSRQSVAPLAAQQPAHATANQRQADPASALSNRNQSHQHRQHQLQQQIQGANNHSVAQQFNNYNYYNQLAANADLALIAHMMRRTLVINLKNNPLLLPATAGKQAPNNNKFECLVEIEGAKARIGAKLLDNQQIVCQENSYTYEDEVATMPASVSVIMNEHATIERTEVLLYKCQLFGAQQRNRADCSLCATLDRRFQCQWCNNQCAHADQCTELPSVNCPPPRIDSIYPLSGPVEGGTIVIIEGSNLGSNEREIHDKVAIGGIPCTLVDYSVSVRIVCRTGASLVGPQSALVVVGNRAGVARAQDKFQYKSIHLTDVNPKFGPMSGGTRLFLTGSNLNIGSKISIFLDDAPCTLDRLEASSRQISCMTPQNTDISTSRVTRLTLNVDNSTHIIPHPFVYHLDPVITSISPIESFVSGGRPLIITGHHLNVPQTVKLLVYHEHYTNIFNGSYCMAENDTWIMCLTPAINKEMLMSVGDTTTTTTSQTRSLMPVGQDQTASAQDQPAVSVNNVNLLNDIQYDNGGLRLKMSIVMDDVRSVRQLDEYYPHLPHYITYYDDPIVYKFPTEIVVYSPDGLVIEADNLKMAYLKEDIIVTIGIKLCTITSIRANQIVCTPPQEPVQPTDDKGYPTERQLPQIVVTIGSNIRQELGYMQYEPSFYSSSSRSGSDMTNDSFWAGPQKALMAIVGLFTFGLAVAMLFVVAFSRYRNSKAEKEYKRIQLQMGSLDVNGNNGVGGGANGGLVRGANCDLDYSSSGGHHSGVPSLSSPSNKKLLASYPSSPLTNFSTMSSGPVANGNSVANHTIHPHITKINGLTTKYTTTVQTPLIGNSGSEQIVSGPNSWTFDNLSSSKSSSGGSPMQKSIERPLISNMNHHHQIVNHHNNLASANDHQQHNYQTIERDSIYNSSLNRRYNWHSDAPSTIVPYAVIEACNVGDRHSEDNKTMRNYV